MQVFDLYAELYFDGQQGFLLTVKKFKTYVIYYFQGLL